MTPKISVIIPVYNAQRYLERCLYSVRNSSLKELEIICVDDGSTDDSLKILYDFQKVDNRIKILEQENLYAGVARNNGLKIATGEYVHFLDADDWVELNAYEKWYSTIKNDKSEVCVCCYKTINKITGKVTEVNKNIYEYKKVSSLNEEPETFICGAVAPWNKLYKLDFLLENKICFDNLICANDRAFYFEVILKAKKITSVKEFFINHVINNSESLVGETRLRNFDVHFKSFDRIWNLYIDKDVVAKKLILQQCIGDCISFYRKSKGTPYEHINRTKMLCFFASINIDLLEDNITEFWFYKDYIEIFRNGLPKSVIKGLNKKNRVIKTVPKKTNFKRTVDFYKANGLIATVQRILKEVKTLKG